MTPEDDDLHDLISEERTRGRRKGVRKDTDWIKLNFESVFELTC